MLNKIVMNCLVDGYLGRIFVIVHGIDICLWHRNVLCAGVDEIYTIVYFWDFCIMRGKMVKCATFDRVLGHGRHMGKFSHWLDVVRSPRNFCALLFRLLVTPCNFSP